MIHLYIIIIYNHCQKYPIITYQGVYIAAYSYLVNNLTPQVAWNVGDMYPAAIGIHGGTLWRRYILLFSTAVRIRFCCCRRSPFCSAPDELCESYLSFLLHLLYEQVQPAVVSSVTGNDVCCTAEEVMAMPDSAYQRIELLASIATSDQDRCSPCPSYRVKKFFNKYVKQMVCTLGRAIVDALALCCSAGGQLFNGKV